MPVNNTYEFSDNTRAYINSSENTISYTNYKFGLIQLESWIIEGDARPNEPAGTILENVEITSEEVYEIVNTLTEDLKIDNISIAEAEKARIVNINTTATVSEGWCITLTRSDGDSVPVSFSSVQMNGILDLETDDYVERWTPESIVIYVDSTGIRSFYWTNPIEVVEELNSNVKLLEFEDVQDRIRSYIEYGYFRRMENGQIINDNKIIVEKIVLTNVLLPIKNDTDHQMIVPAWIIFYKDIMVIDDETIEGSTTIFAVNAIDGSSIDLSIQSNESAKYD